MSRNWLLSAATTTALLAGLAVPMHSAGADGVKSGMLTCEVDSGWGFVFGSSRDLKCTYSHDPQYQEHYVGKIKKFGVDIGYMSASVMAWAVVAPTNNVGKGALAGDYVGAAGSAAVGVGVGANVLTGGFQDSFALQPVSMEGQTGLNVAGGIAALSLEYKPQ